MDATPAGDRRVLPPGGTRRHMVPVQQGHKEPGREGTRERNMSLTCNTPPAKASGGTKRSPQSPLGAGLTDKWWRDEPR